MAPTTPSKIDAERRRVAATIPRALRLDPATLPGGGGKGGGRGGDVTEVPGSCRLLSPEELRITASDPVELRDGIAAGRVAAARVVSAFAKRAAVAQQLTCCLVDLFIAGAVADAEALDDHFRRTGKVVGPLHGLPVSLKDHIELAGRPAPTATAAWIDWVPEKDAHIVRLLRAAGAVFFCKTTMPQTGMHVETDSFYGRTLNPHNTALSPGGSSGGEGALLALRGSCLGVGTDVGGSIRIPAAHCGVWGYKPTPGLLPQTGIRSLLQGATAIPSTCGPLSTSLQGLALVTAAVHAQMPHRDDPALAPPPPGLASYAALTSRPRLGRPLRLGVLRQDGVVRPLPPVERALEWAARRLGALPGVELVGFRPWRHDRAQALALRLFYSDGQRAAREVLGDEPLTPLTAKVMSKGFKPLSLAELYEATVERDEYRRGYLEHWNASGIDLLLSPCAHSPAPPHDGSGYIAYTAHWNLLAYPAATFPTGLRVDPAVDGRRPEGYQPLNRLDASVQRAWDPELSANAPLGLQLVARPWDDVLLFQGLHLVEAVLAPTAAA